MNKFTEKFLLLLSLGAIISCIGFFAVGFFPAITEKGLIAIIAVLAIIGTIWLNRR